MISSFIGVLIFWFLAVDRIPMFHTEGMREADRDTVLVTLSAFMSRCSWIRFCWALDLP